MNDMQKKPAGAPRPANREARKASPKAPYSTPALRVYGSVAELTQGGTGTQQDRFGKGKVTGSDRRIKENLVRVGTHPLGIGLYLFDYRPEHRGQWGEGRQFGVMADEVEAVLPAAVSRHPGGYLQVDYAMLGVSVPRRH
jgi:hypothetical protein